MNKITIKFLLTLSIILMGQHSQAAIYKCKNSSGSIEYLATPCPKGTAKKDISTLPKSKQQQGTSKAKVSMYEIKTVSDGMSNILRNGFANENLKTLKEDYLNRKKRSNAYRLTEKSAVWEQYLWVTINPNSTRGIEIEYNARRSKQKAAKLSEFELARAEKAFDLSLMDVNFHATRIGLKNKSSKVKALGAKEIEWNWLEDGFKCEMNATIDKKKRYKNALNYKCKYQGA